MINIKQELLTVKELSAILKVSPNTIYYWLGRDEIPFVRFGKHYRFELPKVLTYFHEQTQLARNDLHRGSFDAK